MYRITIRDSQEVIQYKSGKNLLQILLDAGVFVDNPCNGKGICGKCKVRILSGEPEAVSETEREILTPEEIRTGIRLSCLFCPKSDLELEILKKERRHKVLTTGYLPDFLPEPDIEKKKIRIQKPALEDQTPLEDQVSEQLGIRKISYELLRDMRFAEGEYTAVIYRDMDGSRHIIGLEEGDTSESIYGIALDIGTTTVVTALVDLQTGKELAAASRINAQKHYGLDVLTRITYELEHPEDGMYKLQEAIVTSINDMIREVCTQAGIARSSIYEITVGANCTMMHMLLGVDAASIGKAPYAPIFRGAKELKASEIGIQAAKGARLYCLPSVSSYIGADIVAGAYTCELHKMQENVLFIDIGTNGEIVFSNRGKLVSCSCAAGPALEGMNISSGMRASEGAIEDVRITEEGVTLTVIGEKEPEGICGSGILAVVKELLRTGLIKKTGAFIKRKQLEESDYRYPMLQLDGTKREFLLTGQPKKLLITQGDIRQVQLAKGAILSGFYALLREVGVSMGELDKVMIAGQFGAHLSVESLIGTGILPEAVRDKLVYVGNSSKTGAYMALMSSTVKREMEELAGHMDYIELGATKEYERLFADCLMFPETGSQ